MADVQILRGYVESLNNIRFGINAQRAQLRELSHYDSTGLTDEATKLLVRIDDELSASVINIVDLVVILNNAMPENNATVMTKLREAIGV